MFALARGCAESRVYGGLAVGVLDGKRGRSKCRASRRTPRLGFLGTELFEGGITTVILGTILHFVVAFGVA